MGQIAGGILISVEWEAARRLGEQLGILATETAGVPSLLHVPVVLTFVFVLFEHLTMELKSSACDQRLF